VGICPPWLNVAGNELQRRSGGDREIGRSGKC